MPLLLMVPLGFGIAQLPWYWGLGFGLGMTIVGVIGSVNSASGQRSLQLAALDGPDAATKSITGAALGVGALYCTLAMVAYLLGFAASSLLWP
jgi:hypothetical protein